MPVTCELCGRELGTISPTHLKHKHNGMTVPDYREMFPDAPIRSLEAALGTSRGLKGKPKSTIHRQQIGKGNARRVWTDESRAKSSASLTKLWATPEYYETQVRKVIQNFQLRPTSIEKQVMALIEELNLPFRYVGDGTCFIARANPDFIGIDSKMIIEVAGDYWHDENYKHERTEYFAKHGGFKTLVIWQHELDCLETVKQRLLAFVGEGE